MSAVAHTAPLSGADKPHHSGQPSRERAACFPAVERHFLMTQPGIGGSVVQRLEEAGFASLAQMRSAGVPEVVARVCLIVGDRAWHNRRRPLERALARCAQVLG